MTTYFVECYWPGVDQQLLTRAAERLASHRGSRTDAVAWLSSILFPDDEIVLCLAEGSSPDAVRASAHAAGLPTERIVPCVHVVPGALPVAPPKGRAVNDTYDAQNMS